MSYFFYGEGDTKLEAEIKLQGNDLIVRIYGGTQPHIGSVAIGIPHPSLKDPAKNSATVSIYTLVGHKDDHLAKVMCQHLAKSLNTTVVVIAGFHIESATQEQIKHIEMNCRYLIKEIDDNWQFLSTD